MVELVNLVGSGDLGKELDLTSIAQAIGGPEASYEPELYPALYLRLFTDSRHITVYRTGKYIIVGANSKQGLNEALEAFFELLKKYDIVTLEYDSNFKIRNRVYVADLGRELNLAPLAVNLGLENSEYEPEQFPGVIFRPPDHHCVVLIFRSGKTVITGARSKSDAENAFYDVKELIMGDSIR